MITMAHSLLARALALVSCADRRWNVAPPCQSKTKSPALRRLSGFCRAPQSRQVSLVGLLVEAVKLAR